MNIEDVTLGKIAVAHLLFDSLTAYNASLADFRCATSSTLDLAINEHRHALLKWLNDWGCRHLSKKNHQVASESILEWYQSECATLFGDSTPVWQLDDRELKTAANAYGSLKDRLGARHSRHNDQLQVHIGPTAASKVLFALRPRALVPWDDAMRRSFGYGDASPESYFKYLVAIRNLALHIRDLCRDKGFQIDDLPGKIDRGRSTVVELLNEYIWVRTRGIELPSSETLMQWASLG
jgi:hypothetical protein